MGEFDIGQPVARTEDPRLLRGGGRYTDDINVPGQTYGAVVRSPHPHALIRSIDPSAALAMPGVLAVLTGEDVAADGLGMIRSQLAMKRRDGSEMYHSSYAALAQERVRYVGDAVAFVVAETPALAKDAAEAVIVEYEPLPAVVDTAASAADGALAVWDDCPDNECFLFEVGDRYGMEAGFAKADVVVSRDFRINRVIANTIEPRSALGQYDAADGRYTVHVGVHYPHRLRRGLAEQIFHVPETDMRVVSTDIGGSFGLRGPTHREIILVLWASKRVGKPVKWTGERSEGFLADTHGRDNVTHAELALDKDGKFLAMKVRTLANIGAYMQVMGAGPPTNNLGTLAGVYTTPAIHVEVSARHSHTNPTSPYRGAGRPEAAYVLESLIETAAREMDIDPIELRRRNTIPPDALPFKTGLTFTYDSGRFEENMDMALGLADYPGFAARKAESDGRGKLRGIGISNTIERAGAPSVERAEIRFNPTGSVTVLVGTISQGQGHDTIYKQIVCDRLGLSPDDIRVMEGDSDALDVGGGTGGSRSATLGGGALFRATEKIEEKGRQIAAHLLEASEADIEFADGSFTVAGTDRSISLKEVAKASYVPSKLSKDIEPGLDEQSLFTVEGANYPNGCHVCEVEIDPDTGEIDIVRYSVVDDVGTVLNPNLLKGQIQGGVAQGVGQALFEDLIFDPDSGQNLTGSFMDYAMPRADDFSMIEVKSNPAPTEQNPLGVKGAGEAGTVGALPAVTNAIINALDHLGVREIPMPATPERLWRVIHETRT